MGTASKTAGTANFPDSVSANILSSPISYILNAVSIGMHEVLGLDTHKPRGGYSSKVFGIMQGIKNAYHNTFLPFADEKKANSGLYSREM